MKGKTVETAGSRMRAKTRIIKVNNEGKHKIQQSQD